MYNFFFITSAVSSLLPSCHNYQQTFIHKWPSALHDGFCASPCPAFPYVSLRGVTGLGRTAASQPFFAVTR